MGNGQSAKREPIFLSDGSEESSKALYRLTRAKLPFSLVPTEGSGLVLLSSGRAFHGLEGVERYIQEKKPDQK